MKDRGIDALINQCLIGPVLSMGATFIAYACALLAYLYLLFTSPAYNSDGGYTPVVVAFAFLIGLQVCQIFTTPLASGVDTIFVAMAWDPEVLIQQHGDLYHQMVQVSALAAPPASSHSPSLTQLSRCTHMFRQRYTPEGRSFATPKVGTKRSAPGEDV